MQVVWVCILCRKKQELLSKTGQWINKTSETEGFIRSNIGSVSFLISSTIHARDENKSQLFVFV